MSQPVAAVLTGRHAIVTGGGRGLGIAIAAALADRGADLTLMGRTGADLDQQASVLRASSSGRIHTVICDVADPLSVSTAFTEATRELGPAHMLINNAGQSDVAPFDAITPESWSRVIAVNLTGTFLCAQQVLPAMIAAGWGRVVNIASTAGLRGYSQVASYCASKHGVIGLTRALAAETARAGVTINAVCPGYTEDTGMVEVAVKNVAEATGKSADEARKILARHSPRGTLITPGEVAATVVWLCSPDASAITGQAIAVAAGEVMR